MKINKIKLLIIFFTSLFISSCGSEQKNNSDDTSQTDTSTMEIDTNLSNINIKNADSMKSVEPTSAWTYSENEDKMTSKKSYYASVDATEILNFDFPYNGGSIATLNIRKRRGETDIFVSFTKGQITINSYEGTQFKVRFDKLPATNYSFTGASDGSSDVAFVQNSSRFMKSLKTHKKVIIEMEFYQEGYRAIEFNISGFKWNF